MQYECDDAFMILFSKKKRYYLVITSRWRGSCRSWQN